MLFRYGSPAMCFPHTNISSINKQSNQRTDTNVIQSHSKGMDHQRINTMNLRLRTLLQ